MTKAPRWAVRSAGGLPGGFMEAGLDGTTLRHYLSCVMRTNAYWEYQSDGTNGPPQDDCGVGMGALIIELLRTIFFPD